MSTSIEYNGYPVGKTSEDGLQTFSTRLPGTSGYVSIVSKIGQPDTLRWEDTVKLRIVEFLDGQLMVKEGIEEPKLIELAKNQTLTLMSANGKRFQLTIRVK